MRVGSGGPRAQLVVSGFALPLRPSGSPELASTVHPLLGELHTGRSVHSMANPFGDELEVPWAATRGDAAPGAIYAVAVVLTFSDHEKVTLPKVRARRDGVEIGWPDGEQDTLDLGAAGTDQARVS